MDVFLALDTQFANSEPDDVVASNLLAKFEPNLSLIGKRIKRIKVGGILYDTPSVNLFDQAKDLFSLGYFASTIMVCRSIAEYLASEIFYEEVEIDGDRLIIEQLAESLDFRKIVNDFLYNHKKGYKIIDKNSAKLFNDLYDLGNQWVHPKRGNWGRPVEEIAFESIEQLGTLIISLRDVMKDFDISKGVLVKKLSGKKRQRPVVETTNH
ncbi:MAG: hypothetical protein WA052_03585 [Microgenomates group bacterium]